MVKLFFKQLLLLVAGLAGVIVLTAGVMFGLYNFLGEPEYSQAQSIILLGALIGFAYVFVRFIKNIRPLLTPTVVSSIGCVTGVAGVIVGLLPLIIASANTPSGGNMYDESGAGAAIWLMMFSVPFGVGIGIVGIAIFRAGVAAKKTDGNKEPPNA